MEDRDLARLLSGRNEPSVIEKEDVFERVVREVASRPAQRSMTAWLWGLAAAGAVTAAIALLVLPRLQDGGDEFAARGGEAPTPSLRVVCVETGQLGACPARGTLAFELDPQRYTYAALFARDVAGAITWYFPRADGKSLAVKDAQGQPLRQGVRLGDSQPPGSYELVLVLSNAPLTRAEVKARLSGADDVRVVHQPLRVHAAP